MDMCKDVENEVRCMRKWIREMEDSLKKMELSVGDGWSLKEMEEKEKKNMVVKSEVE
jgi:hypothetical protein